MKIMTDAGSKGSRGQTTSMVAMLGQVHIGPSMPKKTMTNNKRWLTTFSVNDKRPESRGFCKHSFFDGLGPDEYFGQAQSGRIGLIGTAVMTKESGSMYKKILKAQEDLLINYDGSVRNQIGIIFQFCYCNGLSTQIL